MPTPLKVGLLCGREATFPPAFLAEVNGRNAGVTAEFAMLGGTRMDEPNPYAVIVDRISHEVPYYRSYVKHAVLEGVAVVNNPFMWSADDKFFGASLCTKLGLAHPKTVVLPNKAYVPGIDPALSLRNLMYPFDWDYLIEQVGLPCILKDAHGGGWRGVYVCRTKEELVAAYDDSGLMTMIAQEFIQWDYYLRCMCLGRKDVLVMPYDTHTRKYLPDDGYLPKALHDRVVKDCLRLVNALGYDMNTVEWAVRDGVPYAIDFMNPAPDMDVNALTPKYFDWCVTHMADMVIDLARRPKGITPEWRWSTLF
jgi:glutathione synthase/RimK-type ligase-like ATP-grasp enzyme